MRQSIKRLLTIPSVVLATVSFFATFSSPLGAAPQASWSDFHADQALSGLNLAENTLTTRSVKRLVERWSVSTLAPVDQSSPIIVGGLALIGSNAGVSHAGSSGGYLTAVRIADGSLAWQANTGSLESAPVSANGLVFAADPSGLQAYRLATGAKAWSVAGGSTSYNYAGLTASGSTLYVSRFNGIEARSQTTGKVLWSRTLPTGSGQVQYAAVSGNTVYVARDQLYALRTSNGSTIWANASGASLASPSVGGSRVYVAAGPGVRAFSTAAGSLLWSASASSYVDVTPAETDSTVLFGSGDGLLHAVRASDGSPLWTAHTGKVVYSSTAIAGSVVYVGTAQGGPLGYGASAFALDTGQRLWSYKSSAAVDSSPAVLDGALYFGVDDGTLRAFGLN